MQATSPLPQDLGQLLCDLQLERAKVPPFHDPHLSAEGSVQGLKWELKRPDTPAPGRGASVPFKKAWAPVVTCGHLWTPVLGFARHLEIVTGVPCRQHTALKTIFKLGAFICPAIFHHVETRNVLCASVSLCVPSQIHSHEAV